MNKEWSEINKNMQGLIKKEDTFYEGIKTLLGLREMLAAELQSFKAELTREQFNAIPFINAKGFHSKTIAYSIWHIFRIEDICAHTLIKGDEQVFFAENYGERTGSPIVTTGNELAGEQIAEFSGKLDLDGLYSYVRAVKKSTDDMLKSLSFNETKRKMNVSDRERLTLLNVVSEEENAAWLIDYWCGKDVRGLIQMPFSRHWIMHIEASLRIKNKLNLK
ncbi:MAG: phage head-tail adapter protein [Oscillospiraceae bacterium]|nr:phage head-tail adapter protein [Oscillospiraceae bacterium]